MEPTARPSPLARLRTPAGRRLLVVLLLGGIALFLYRYVAGRPQEAEVVVRWDGPAPAWITVSWWDGDGDRLRWRRVTPARDATRLRDACALPPGDYRVRVEFFAAGRVRRLERDLPHPGSSPLHLFLEDAPSPGPQASPAAQPTGAPGSPADAL